MTTRHTDDQIAAAADRFERWADDLEPEAFETVADLRAVAVAADAVHDAERRLTQAVQTARDNGHSWNRIAIGLGVSRQAARQRFATRLETPK